MAQDAPIIRGYEIDPEINNLTAISGRVSNDEAVQWLKARLLIGNCYTWAGVALVAINARQQNISDLFSEEIKEYYRNYNGKVELSPHVYAVATRTLHRLLNEMGKKHQTIVISGDSGSGKTFTASHLLNMLITHESHRDMKEIPANLRKIWTSVPILMSFGNARTECNDNSSRFGKLIKLQYKFGSIKGAFIETFLLEKTRVSWQGKCQRNFHIFHQILAGCNEDKLATLELDRLTKYSVVPGPVLKSDELNYEETLDAMQELGMSVHEIDYVLGVLAAIIHLGNIKFQIDSATDVCDISYLDRNCWQSLQAACKLLGLSQMILSKLLTSTMIAPQASNRRCTIYHIPIEGVDSCESRRDCLMRYLYERLFQWIVSYINCELRIDDVNNSLNLGILDIYGFEVFENNSLEQLCINYANERLQNYFVKNFIDYAKYTLQFELDDEFVYESCDKYDVTLMLLHSPSTSVFSILNEESVLSRHKSEKAIQERIIGDLSECNSLIPPKYSSNKPEFTIQHYAGKVCYSVYKMCEKNMDKVPKELKDILKASSNSFVCMMAQGTTDKPSTKRSTVLDKYQTSLDELLHTLDGTSIHFIRCVKASDSLEPPGMVDVPFFKQQLVASGVFDLIPLNCHRFRHFPYWFKSSDFVLRYQRVLSVDTSSSSDIIKRLQDNVEMRDHIKVGRMSVFVSETGINQLEEWQQTARLKAVVVIQKAWRLYMLRNMCSKVSSDLSQDIEPCTSTEDGEDFSFTDDNTSNDDVTNEVFYQHEDIRSPVEAPRQVMRAITRVDVRGNTFSRLIFSGDQIISRLRLAEVPIRFHTRATCLSYSHCLPASELPRGLIDAI